MDHTLKMQRKTDFHGDRTEIIFAGIVAEYAAMMFYESG